MSRLPRLRKWLLRPVYPGRWFRAVGHVLLCVLQAVWRALEWGLADKVHWAVISRLLLLLVLYLAMRYGWAANAKLDWLVKLFSPIFNAELPKGIVP